MSELFWRVAPSVVESALEALLPAPIEGEERGLAQLQNAKRYAVLGGGKRTRPLLLMEVAGAVHEAVCGSSTNNSTPQSALDAACAVELIHAYSLVHDDLPAMDDAALRRGKPTVHTVYGDAMAVLAGDALQSLAFEVAARAGNARVVLLIAQAAGTFGMCGGQAIDIEWSHELDGLHISGEQLLRLHALKTGAMIRVCAEAGAVLGGGDETQIANMRAYGEHLGRAFQICDDVLDATGDPSVTGKSASDAQNDKITAVAVWGVEGAKKRALDASQAAVSSIELFGREADTLRALARFVVERNK